MKPNTLILKNSYYFNSEGNKKYFNNNEEKISKLIEQDYMIQHLALTSEIVKGYGQSATRFPVFVEIYVLTLINPLRGNL